MPVDPLDYRSVIGRFATGVTVVTAVHGDEPFGMTANSVTSVSLEPTLLLVCFIHGSRTGIAVKEAGFFGVNILEESQEDLSNRFAATANDWDGFKWYTGSHGVPLFEETLGRLVCKVDKVLDGGDHEIVLGEVIECEAGDDADPLLFYKGKYLRRG